MISSDDYVNRKNEFRLFRALLDRERTEIVFTIQGQELQGKSDLLINYYEHCVNMKIPAIMIDFKHEANHDQFTLLEKICELRPSHVPSYINRREQFIQTGLKVEIRNIVQVGNPQLQMEVNHPPEIRRLWYSIMTKDLINDIGTWDSEWQGVLLIDTYEKISNELKDWIENKLIPSCCSLGNIVIVIAGQQVPKRPKKRENHWLEHKLMAIDADEWINWIQVKQWEIPEEVVRHFWRACDGNTGLIKTLIVTDAMFDSTPR